jgi:putative spermidine/putrescine transport system substrate-binding protein
MVSKTKGMKKNGVRAVTRRQFIKTSLASVAAAGASSLIFPRYASAKPKQIVHSNWGGDAVRCWQESFGKSFTAETGVKILIDGTGPLEGKIKAMAESNNVTWDVIDADSWNVIRLGRLNILEPIDYSIVDEKKQAPGYRWQNASTSYVFSHVLAYDVEKCGSNRPKNWADFWDIKKYPGKRALYKYQNGALEAALLADGVSRKNLYPLDIERALRKIEDIKEHLIFWSSGAESQQMFLQKEIVMGELWNSRASVLNKDTNGRVDFTWNEGIVDTAGYVVLKGNPAGREWAMRWLAKLQDPDSQVELFRCIGTGCTNPASVNIIKDKYPELQRFNPSEPENYKLQIPLDYNYYADKYEENLDRYLDLIST